MGCCMTSKKPRINTHQIESTRKSLKKMESQKSRVEEIKDQIFENTLYGNEDNYYDEDELPKIDNKQLLHLVDTNVEENEKRIRWQIGEPIGSGSFGRVSNAMNLDTGQLIAVKQVLVQNGDEERLDALGIEIELLSLLKHKNIVSYYGMERVKNQVNIFLEHVGGGSLSQMIKKFGSFNENIIRVYTKQILEGLEYLHSNGIIHRDIKGGNVLVDKSGICKLADFGSSKKLQSIVGDGSLFGTPNFMAPEVVQQTKTGRKADIWSLGCTVIELVTGQPPWTELMNQFAIMIKIAKGEIPKIPENLSEQGKDFLSHCLEVDQFKRWNAVKLLKHPFLQVKQSKLETPVITGTPLRRTPGSKQKKMKFEYPSQGNSNILQIPPFNDEQQPRIASTKVIQIQKHEQISEQNNVSEFDVKPEAESSNHKAMGSDMKSDFELGSINCKEKGIVHYLLNHTDKDEEDVQSHMNNDNSKKELQMSGQLIKQTRKLSPIPAQVWMQEC